MLVASSYSENNTWHIFREDGKEVKFTILNGIIKSYHYKLTNLELAYIKNNLIHGDRK